MGDQKQAGLDLDFEKLGLGQEEQAAVNSFFDLLIQMQEFGHDFGMREVPNYVLPAKISQGTVRHARDAAENRAADVRTIARSMLTARERLIEALKIAQEAQYKYFLTQRKCDEFTTKQLKLAERRAEDKCEQQLQASSLTAFTMPTLAELQATKRRRNHMAPDEPMMAP